MKREGEIDIDYHTIAGLLVPRTIRTVVRLFVLFLTYMCVGNYLARKLLHIEFKRKGNLRQFM